MTSPYRSYKTFLEKCKLLREKGNLKNFKRGETILTEGTAGFSFYLILKGMVDIVLYSSEGRRVLLNTLKEGDFFGEMSVLEGLPRSANVEARTDCKVLEIYRDDFLYAIRKSPDCAILLLTELCKRLRETNEKIRILSIASAEERVKRYIELLWAKSKAENKKLILPSRRIIGEEIGLTRETVTRIIKRLEKNGWLREFLEEG